MGGITGIVRLITRPRLCRIPVSIGIAPLKDVPPAPWLEHDDRLTRLPGLLTLCTDEPR